MVLRALDFLLIEREARLPSLYFGVLGGTSSLNWDCLDILIILLLGFGFMSQDINDFADDDTAIDDNCPCEGFEVGTSCEFHDGFSAMSDG